MLEAVACHGRPDDGCGGRNDLENGGDRETQVGVGVVRGWICL